MPAVPKTSNSTAAPAQNLSKKSEGKATKEKADTLKEIKAKDKPVPTDKGKEKASQLKSAKPTNSTTPSAVAQRDAKHLVNATIVAEKKNTKVEEHKKIVSKANSTGATKDGSMAKVVSKENKKALTEKPGSAPKTIAQKPANNQTHPIAPAGQELTMQFQQDIEISPAS